MCKFFLRDSCSRGHLCKFSHDSYPSCFRNSINERDTDTIKLNQNAFINYDSQQTQSMELDAICDGLKNTKLSVPSHISFGRTGKKGRIARIS